MKAMKAMNKKQLCMEYELLQQRYENLYEWNETLAEMHKQLTTTFLEVVQQRDALSAQLCMMESASSSPIR